jgi:hypothetical protein
VTAAKKHLRRCCFDALVVEEKLVLNKSSCVHKPELLKVAGSTPVVLIGSCIDSERSKHHGNSKVMRSIQVRSYALMVCISQFRDRKSMPLSS